MRVLVDTSVVLGTLLGQSEQVTCWGKWSEAYVSELVQTEYLRSLDRLRLQGALTDEDRVRLRLDFETFWKTCHRVPVSTSILTRASEPFPTVLGTLDAIHLATLLQIQNNLDIQLTLLTHDEQLARAARACNVRVQP